MYKKIDLPAAWNAELLQEHPDWCYTLTDLEISELEHAASAHSYNNYESLSIDKFVLPTLSRVIKDKFLEQLETGIGCLLLRGLEPLRYKPIQLENILYGLGLHFGTPLFQSMEGEKLHAVYSQNISRDDARARGTNTSFALGFHNDPCDVAGLLCVRNAKEGGASQIVSSVAIHNKMLTDYPELLHQLYQPYYCLAHRVNKTATQSYYHRPIFAIEKGCFMCNILRRYIDLASQSSQCPSMTPLQIKALDTFEELLSSDEYCHTFMLKPGDILFVNNYLVLHAREKFEDTAEKQNKRLLQRLWLSVSNSRPLPESYRPMYREIEAGAVRGGFLPEED